MVLIDDADRHQHQTGTQRGSCGLRQVILDEGLLHRHLTLGRDAVSS